MAIEPQSSPSAPSDVDAAFVADLTATQAAIRLYVMSLMPGDAAAGDVIQAANAKIWQNRRDFSLGTSFTAWALTLARFEVLTYRKRQLRDSRLCFTSELENTIASDLQSRRDDCDQIEAALQTCLQTLSPRSRDLITQRYATTESLTEFATRVRRSAASVKVTLHRLRQQLADCIERRLEAQSS